MSSKALVVFVVLVVALALGVLVMPRMSDTPRDSAIATMLIVNEFDKPVTFTHNPNPLAALGDVDPMGPVDSLKPGFIRLAPGESRQSKHTETRDVIPDDFKFVVTAWTSDSEPVEARVDAGSWVIRFQPSESDPTMLAAQVSEQSADE